MVTSVKKTNTNNELKSKFCPAKNILEENNEVSKLTNTEEIKNFYEYTEECLKKILKLKIPTKEEISDLIFDLPFEKELKNKKLAIFDLDETLIHCEARKPQRAHKQIICNLPAGGQTMVIL